MRIFSNNNSKHTVAVLVAFFSIFIAFILSSLVIFDTLQLKLINSFFSLRGAVQAPDSSIVIIAIDDQTIKSLPGKMPYPRSFYARLVRNLSAAGAKLIVFDLEFTESNLENPNDDLLFARAVADVKNVVLACKVVFEVGNKTTDNMHLLEPIAPLLRSGASWGLVNVVEDSDGFIRRYLLFQRVGSNIYYPLSIEAAKVLLKADRNDGHDPKSRFFSIGNRRIPKVTANSMLINFCGPTQTFTTYSMVSILDDSTYALLGDEDTDIFDMHLEWGTFRDKIVFVGASAEELQDNKFTPYFNYSGRKQKMPGVELHANALSTILRGDFIKTVDIWFILFFVGISTILASQVSIYFRPFRALLTVALLVALTIVLAYLLFVYKGLIFIITMPLMANVFTFVINITYQTVTEQREKARIRQTFQHYVAPSIVDKMLSTGELPAYGGERRELTLLFSDIRKFTGFTENHEPEFVVSRLYEYLSEMVEVIFKYNGTLDKFVGDEIMALFGAPYHFEDHAERACRSALEMVERLREIQRRWSEDKKGYFNIGIGINTGKVIVGNLGSKQLFDYTVIGDQVNLGARLEGANKEYETTIIISESTYQQIKNKVKVRELDIVRVLGRSKPVRIYELRGMDSIPQIEQDYIIDVYNEGLLAYRQKRWADAIKAFRRVLRYFPSDGPSRIYTIRCLSYLEKPAPVEWDGIFELKHK